MSCTGSISEHRSRGGNLRDVHLPVRHFCEEPESVAAFGRNLDSFESAISADAHGKRAVVPCRRTHDQCSLSPFDRNGITVVVQVDRDLPRRNNELDGHLTRRDCDPSIAGYEVTVTKRRWREYEALGCKSDACEQ